MELVRSELFNKSLSILKGLLKKLDFLSERLCFDFVAWLKCFHIVFDELIGLIPLNLASLIRLFLNFANRLMVLSLHLFSEFVDFLAMSILQFID